LSEKHSKRFLTEYTEEQVSLEPIIEGLEEKINNLNNENLKTESFLELARRYTDFSELTTPMLNEFIDKVFIYEKDKKNSNEKLRVDINFNFIGKFEVPENLISPYEIEEWRKQERELEEKRQKSKELKLIQNKKSCERQREFRRRRLEGELTEEELIKYEKSREKRQIYNREYSKKLRELNPPKERKLSIAKIVKRKNEGLPLSDEELKRYTDYRERTNKNARNRNARIRDHKKLTTPPKITFEQIKAKKKEGLPLDDEEMKRYTAYKNKRNARAKLKRQAKKLATEKLANENLEPITELVS